MPDKRSHVAAGADGVERGAIFRPRSPRPRHGGRDGPHRQVLDVAEHVHQRGLIFGLEGGQRDGTVASHDRRHAVQWHRIHAGVPPDRPVKVSVDVNEPRRDIRAVGVQLHLTLVAERGSDLHDDPVAYPDVGRCCRSARTVDDPTAPDEQISHTHPLKCRVRAP